MMTKTSVKLALWGLASCCISAQAIEFKLNTVLPGKPIPPNAPPWLMVDIVQNPAHQDWIDITFTANLVGGEKIGSALLNFAPPLNAGTALTYQTFNVNSGNVDFDKIEQSNDAFALQGDGWFDLVFNFKTSQALAFDGTDSITFSFSGTGLTPNMFDYPSVRKGGNERSGYTAGAHLQALGLTGGDDSTSIVTGPSVPDACSTFALLSLGLATLDGLRRNFRQ